MTTPAASKNLSLPCTDDILPGFSFRRVGVVSTGKRGTGGLKPNGEEPYVNNVTFCVFLHKNQTSHL
ncbi:hypothetical protein, partial [Klebsiella pneumoniae]|uniref:hypothetical protein n=1 Tax=Klebsiella pneumoniae TaxID=573 RepID=UPI00396AAC1B